MASLTVLSFAFDNASALSCDLIISSPRLVDVTGGPVRDVSAGDQLVLATRVTNCINKDQPFIVIVEARNSEGVTESLALQSGVLEGGEQAEVGLSWIPMHGDNYEARVFAITDLDRPLVLSRVMTSRIQIAERNIENLILEFNVTKTNLSTAEPFGTTYNLVNGGRKTVALTVDTIGYYESLNGATPRRIGPDSSCIWRSAPEIELPDAVLKPGESMNLTERSSVASAPKYPAAYYYTPFVGLSVQGQCTFNSDY